MSEKRYLILAEGHSGDPHYGKTARGVIRYAPDPTVVGPRLHPRWGDAGRDSDRRHRRRSPALRPDHRGRRRRHAGRPLPAGMARAAQGVDLERARRRERPARVHLRGRGARRARRPSRGRVARPAQAARRAERAHRREPRDPGADRADRRLRLRDREENRRPRARPRGPAPRSRLRVRPDRPDGDRDRRLGDRRRRGRLRLPRGRGRAARRRGSSSRWRAPLRRRPGLALASRLLGGHPRPDARLRAARLRALPQGRLRPRSRDTPGTRCRACRSWSSCTSESRCRCARPASHVWR